jgi:hypothetical protein
MKRLQLLTTTTTLKKTIANVFIKYAKTSIKIAKSQKIKSIPIALQKACLKLRGETA